MLTTSPNITSGEWVARCGNGSGVSGGSGGAALVDPVLGDWRSGSGGALIVGSEEGAGR